MRQILTKQTVATWRTPAVLLAVLVTLGGLNAVAAPVSVDSITTIAADAGSFTLGHSIAGPNRLLLVTVNFVDNGDSVEAVTFEGAPLSLAGTITQSSGKPRLELWQLWNPTAGTGDVQVTIADSHSAKAAVAAVSMVNADPLIPLDTCITKSAKSTSGSIVMPSEAGDLIISAVVSLANGSIEPSILTTLLWSTVVSGEHYCLGFSRPGANSVNVGWALPESKEWAAIAVNINHLNFPPVIAPRADTAIAEGDTLEFILTAFDEDGTIPSLTAGDLPDGARFKDNGDGTGDFEFESAQDGAGVYVVTFVADDGNLADTLVISITVAAENVAPVLQAIGPQSVPFGGTLSFEITASDADGTTPAFSVVPALANAALTDLANGHATYDFTPDVSQIGAHDVMFIAGDGLLADSESVRITVIDTTQLTYIRIELESGAAAGDTSLTTDYTLTLYCRGYRSDDSPLGDVAVSWSVSGPDSIALAPVGSQPSCTLDLVHPGQGYVIAEHGSAHIDSTGLVTCAAGLPDRLYVTPDSYALDLGDTLQFSVASYDADSNPTEHGLLTWTALGHVGEIDAEGLFLSTQPGTGRIAVATDLSAAVDTTGPLTVQAVYVDPVALGANTVHAGDRRTVMLAFEVGNYYESSRSITSLTVRNISRGAGTREQIAGSLDSLAIYLDRDISYDLSLWDTLIGVMSPGTDSTYTWPVSIALQPAGEQVVLLAADVGVAPHDGDSLDFAVVASSDLALSASSVIGGPDTVNSYGYNVVDGMTAEQIGLTAGAPDTISWLDGPIRVLSIDVPRNGYAPDMLTSLSVSNAGTAVATDVDSIALYIDNGDRVWDNGVADICAGRLTHNGLWWSRSGLAIPLDSQITALYIVAVASRFATRGATLQLGVPQFGVGVASHNDGPIDQDLVSTEVVTVTSERELEIDVVPLVGGSIAWGTISPPLLSLQLTNHSGEATAIDSITIASYATAPGATQAQLDAQFDSLMLYHDLDGIASSIGGADSLIASTRLFDGEGTFATSSLLLAGGSGTARLTIVAAVSEDSARDGNPAEFGLASADDVFCSPSLAVTGGFPAVNPYSFTLSGFATASLSALPVEDLELVGGQLNCTLFRFTLPGNGYTADTLQTVRLVNRGSLQEAGVLRNLRLWRDVTADGFTPDDVRLADFNPVGPEWLATSAGTPISAAGMALVVTADISPLSFGAGTFEPAVPVGGVSYRSGLSGPDDAVFVSPYPILIMPADRITVISLTQAGSVVSPGTQNVAVLAFALYNGYTSDKSLSGLYLSNLTRSSGGADYIDQELGQVRLYDDPLASRATDSSILLASGFFSDGYLQLNGFQSVLPSESLSYFFVAANLADNATDSDTLIVSVPNSAGFGFGEPLSVNGDLPLVDSRPIVVDGSVMSQYEALPIASRTVRPGDTAQVIMAFRAARNGILTDLLEAVSISVSGAAGPSDLPVVRLWLDRNSDDLWQPTDSALGLMTYDTDRWTLGSLSLVVDTMPPAIFVVADVSAGVTSGTELEASIPVNGCAYASDNDGPRDAPLASGASFVVYESQLQAAGLEMRQTYSIGETVCARFTAQNLFAVPLTGVTGEMIRTGDTAAIRLDSCSAPITLDPGESSELRCYYTAVQEGQLSIAMRALATDIDDSSAYISSPQLKIQSQPSEAIVALLNSAPASVTRGQRNVFPLTISVAHPDTGLFSAALQIEGIRFTVRDGSGAPQPANGVFARMALGADYANYAVAYPVPEDDTVHLTFAQPVVIAPGARTQLALLVDIDSASTVTSFALSLDNETALVIGDHNNGLPVPVTGATAFPMSTAASRIDIPSLCLAVSGSSIESRRANLDQAGIVTAGIQLRHPADIGGSPLQLTALTLEFADSAGQPLAASQAVSRLGLVSSGTEWAAASGTLLDDSRLALELSSPVTLGPGESRLIEVVCRIAPLALAEGFRIIVPDSTCLLVREIGSGATLPAATDPEVLTTSSAFPITGTWIDICAPAMEPRVCLVPSLPSSVVAGTDAVALIGLSMVYPDCADCSPLNVDGVFVRALDSLGVPLDPQSLFDRIGIAVASEPLWYQPYVDLVQGDVRFRFGDTGLTLSPGDSVMVQLVADFETAPASDNLVLMIGAENDLSLEDAADTSRELGVAVDGACPLEFPFTVGPAALIQPAGRPSVASGGSGVVVAYRGQAAVSLLDLDIDYSQLGAQGDLGLGGLNGRVYRRTAAGLTPINASSLVSAVALWIGDSLVAAGPVTAGATLGLALSQPVPISSGELLTVRLLGDISITAERGNYLFVLEDSAAIMLSDLMLDAPMYPLSAGGVFPLSGAELSVTGATLQESFSNFPNPFVPSSQKGTTIAYVLPEAARVSIAIFTITGDLVADLVTDEPREAGEHQSDTWSGVNGNGREVIPGTYICRIMARYSSGREETLQRKVAVIR